MSAQLGADEKCGDCAFWAQMDKMGGNCRRRAPRPNNNSDEIAHWPRTDWDDGCGDWFVRSAGTPLLVFCRECVFWKHQAGGLHPVDLQDQFSDWWRHAGKCLRFSPQPSAFPGNRAFWRVTHESDACSEGSVRGDKAKENSAE
jgi:hypothetical protein